MWHVTTLQTVPCWRPCLIRSDVSVWFPAGQGTSPTPPGFHPLSWHSSRLGEHSLNNGNTLKTQWRCWTFLLRHRILIRKFTWRHRVRWFEMINYLSDLFWSDGWTESGARKPEMIAWIWNILICKSHHRWRRGKAVAFTKYEGWSYCVRGQREYAMWGTCGSGECWSGWCSCSSRSSDWPGSERRGSRSGLRRAWNKDQIQGWLILILLISPELVKPK